MTRFSRLTGQPSGHIPVGLACVGVLIGALCAYRPPAGLGLILVLWLLAFGVSRIRLLVVVALPLSIVLPPIVRLPVHGLPDPTPIRLLLTVAAVGVTLHLYRTKHARLTNRVFTATMWLYITCVGAAYLLAPHHAGALSRAISYTIEMFIPAGLAAWGIKSKADITTLCNSLIAIVTFSAFFGIAEIAMHKHFIPADGSFFFHAPDRGGYLRTQGIFPHPIVQGVAVGLTLPLTLALLLRAPHRRRYAIAFVLQLIGLIVTFSRGPWIATALAMVAMILLLRGTQRAVTLSLSLLAVTIFAISPIGDTGGKLLGSLSGSSSEGNIAGYSVEYRQQLLHAVTQYVDRHPLGAGINAEADLYLPGNVGGNPTNLAHSIDNAYAKILLELGWPGLISFALVLLALLGTTFITWYQLRASSSGPLVAAMVAAELGMLINSASVATWTWAQLSIIFWMIAGMVFALRRVTSVETSQQLAKGVSTTRHALSISAP